jgi:hypothetical protein
MAGLLVLITDVHALGLQAAQGLLLTASFYREMDDKTREWAKRYFAKMNRMPTMWQAGVYSSVMHYLNSIKETGTDDPLKVAAKMRNAPSADPRSAIAHRGISRFPGSVLSHHPGNDVGSFRRPNLPQIVQYPRMDQIHIGCGGECVRGRGLAGLGELLTEPRLDTVQRAREMIGDLVRQIPAYQDEAP